LAVNGDHGRVLARERLRHVQCHRKEERQVDWAVGPWQPVDWPGTEVGWALIKDAWGKGYALESSKAAIDWAFATLNWSEVIHIISPENHRSKALAQRLGATNRGPTKLPPPNENVPVDLWQQSREHWSETIGS